MLAARLSDDLTKNHKVRRLPVRTGDSVRVMRGDFAGLEGKVQRVDYSNGRIFVEGMAREKAAGVSSQLPIHVTSGGAVYCLREEKPGRNERWLENSAPDN